MHYVRMLVSALFITVLMFIGAGAATQTNDFPVPVETIQPPVNLTVGVQVDQVGMKVVATFRGGFGQALLKGVEISLVTPDGKKQTQNLGLKVGDTVTFTGSGCGDQIIGNASYMNGVMYPFLNQMIPYQNSYCSADYVAYVDPCEIIAASPSLKPDPVMEIPVNKSVIIQANVDIQTIVVEFRGGFGQNILKSIEVTRYSPDGSIETKGLDNRVGSTVSFKATNGCMERIGADVSFMDGTKYHFFDEVLHISRTY